MANLIDPHRHFSIFDPERFGDRPVHIIGAGATGSKIAIEIAKLGVRNLIVHDFDVIEPHNLANQAYIRSDVGKPKVEALAEHIKAATGMDITKSLEKVTGATPLSGVVFLLTDTMSSRKDIWEGAIRMKLGIELMIETRMGVDAGRIYTVIPTERKHIKKWESTLISDDDARVEVSTCGSSVTVGATAGTIAGLAVWQFIRYYNIHIVGQKDDSLENEILLGLRDSAIISTRF